MSRPDAYSVYQVFAPQPAQAFEVDRHYLLYAMQGSMRLEADGQSWSLPPARAALIAAGKAITVSLPHKMTACSVLFDTGFVPAPPRTLSVFEMSPLAKELILECRSWGAGSGALNDYARQMFATLAQVAWRLSTKPSPTFMPVGRSKAVIQAIELTEAKLADAPQFDDIARTVAATPRSLARKFSDELGMTWSQALRRLRIIKAIEELAQSDAPATKVAFRVGYNSLSAFNAAFRDLTGQTPTQYRDSFHNGAHELDSSPPNENQHR